MKLKGNPSSKKNVEGEISEQNINMINLVKTMLKNFLTSDGNYGAITDVKADTNSIYTTMMDYVNKEKLDVYVLKLEDHILLSKTNVCFEELYKAIKKQSELEIKKEIIEIWNDTNNKILHLIILPVRKHFPIEYSTTTQKTELIEKISSMTLADP